MQAAAAHVLEQGFGSYVGVFMLESTSSATWELHPQLARDTVPVGDLPLSRVLLMLDANYPWLLLVPRAPQAVEIIDLDEPAQMQLLREVSRAGRVLKAVTACDKLNIAAIGNVVAQLHVHVIARFHRDPTWPKPVWGSLPPRTYDPAERERLVAVLRGELELPSFRS
jgi:diadenosine tetraphosphate (Ap4A) HIT family hydrolase